MQRIRLELARTQAHPEGSRHVGYEFTVPLRKDGRIDGAAFVALKDRCRVRRFRPGEADDVGHVIRKPGGSWAFHYDIHSDEEADESGYRFGDHVFKTGEYVTVREDDELMPYRVVEVRAL
ncbi:MAG: hypothetical protein LCH46_02565 [Proteobacteria bacterium]|nr:hypothetical protein [Pseudomonadota bacterium]